MYLFYLGFAFYFSAIYEESYEYNSLEKLEELNSAERNALAQHHCSNLKDHMHNHHIENVVSTLNTLWDLYYPNLIRYKLRRNESRNIAEEMFNKMLQNCSIETKLKTHLIHFVEHLNGMYPGGIIDIRTLNQKNANVVIKHGYKRSACSLLRQLLICLEADDFPQLYPDEKIIALAVNFQVRFGRIIQDWIGLLYQSGKLLNVEQAAKCLNSRAFSDLKFKEKSLFDYFEN